MKNRNGPVTARARSDPDMIYSSRGDPPILLCARGRPPQLRNFRDGPPAEYVARGKPPEIRNTRDGPAEYAARGKPPELAERSTLSGQNWPPGRGMPPQLRNFRDGPPAEYVARGKPGREGIFECLLPEGKGKKYRPDRPGIQYVLKRYRSKRHAELVSASPGIQYVLKRYSLPSALADGHVEIWMTELVGRSTLMSQKWPHGRGMPGGGDNE